MNSPHGRRNPRSALTNKGTVGALFQEGGDSESFRDLENRSDPGQNPVPRRPTVPGMATLTCERSRIDG